MDDVKRSTAGRFSDVDHVSPQQVQQWLDSPGEDVLLLDARTAAEYEVSHLRGALHVSPDASAQEVVAAVAGGVPEDRRIVTYCSLGVRSAKMARRLKEAGYTNVHNMNGAIFQWANEGRPVYRGDERVDKVHPYNSRWGEYLKPELRAETEAAE